MANTVSKKPSFAFCYGYATGKLHGRLMKRLLIQRGYQPATPETADIIVAHSAGCWLIPSTAKPKLVMYVGMPLAEKQGKTWLKAQLRPRLYLRRRYLRMVHVYYLLVRRRHNRAIQNMAGTARPSLFPNSQTVFITNRYDPWPSGKLVENFLRDKPWAFISLPGGHNNIWREPEKYVSIIDHYARLLA